MPSPDADGTIRASALARRSSGNCPAAILIAQAGGRKHAIFFGHNRATRAEITQPDGNKPPSVRRRNDLNMVRVRNERYEIPHSAVTGD